MSLLFMLINTVGLLVAGLQMNPGQVAHRLFIWSRTTLNLSAVVGASNATAGVTWVFGIRAEGSRIIKVQSRWRQKMKFCSKIGKMRRSGKTWLQTLTRNIMRNSGYILLYFSGYFLKPLANISKRVRPGEAAHPEVRQVGLGKKWCIVFGRTLKAFCI